MCQNGMSPAPQKKKKKKVDTISYAQKNLVDQIERIPHESFH